MAGGGRAGVAGEVKEVVRDFTRKGNKARREKKKNEHKT